MQTCWGGRQATRSLPSSVPRPLRHQGTQGWPAQALAWARLGPAGGLCLAASMTGQVSACLSEPLPGVSREKCRSRCVAGPMCAD